MVCVRCAPVRTVFFLFSISVFACHVTFLSVALGRVGGACKCFSLPPVPPFVGACVCPTVNVERWGAAATRGTEEMGTGEREDKERGGLRETPVAHA